MKHLKTIAMVLAATAFAGCSTDRDPYAPTGGEALRIEASVDEIVLSPDGNDAPAVTFTWNRGYTYGDNVAVEYCFKMDIADNDFVTATELEVLGPDTFERSFTGSELNDLCLEYWNITPGEPVRLEAKVIERLTADKFIMPNVATTAFNVQTFTLPSVPMWITGSALGRDGSIRMTEEVLSRQYSYKGAFVRGSYCFPMQQDALLPAWFAGEAGDSEAELCSESEGRWFTITRDATYRVVLNTRTRTQRLIYYPRFEQIYMVGDATPGGWTIENSTPLEWVEGTSQFFYDGILYAGELKFPAGEASWNVPFYMALTAGCSDLTVTGMQFVEPGGVDYKWVITDPGNYRVTLDIDALTIKFEKH